MFRIDNDTAAVALPTPAAVGPNPDGYFTDGNPGSAIPATVVDADWANAVQEEITYVIEESGATLDKADNTQLKVAIDAMIAASVIGAAASETVAGIAELATQAEALTGTDDARIMTPLKVTKLFSDTGRQSLAASGYQKLPGGLILQWGSSGTNITSETTTTITFPVAFPTGVLYAGANTINTGADTDKNTFFQEVSVSTTQFAFYNQAAPSTVSLTTNGYRWFAIGY